ncbi:olfactory receptor 52B2-like [Stigmatopora nigra]
METLPNTSSSTMLTQSYDIPPEGVVPVFFLASLSYAMILICNLILLLTIVLNKKLRQPMYMFLLNMPVNDLLGSSAFFLHLFKSLLSENGRVWFPACVTQAFLIHIYAAGTVLILTAMAYDRYVAICLPLQYNAVMTQAHVARIVAGIWLMALLLIGVLFFLLLRLPRCRSIIHNIYCDNPSLLALVCVDTTINHAYGLFTVALTQLLANSVIIYSYFRILMVSCRSRRVDTKVKAVQTCATHLFVFLFLESLGLFTIISYRIKQLPPTLRHFIGSSTLIFPPWLNPIVYGIKTKEIRSIILHFFREKITKSCAGKLCFSS